MLTCASCYKSKTANRYLKDNHCKSQLCFQAIMSEIFMTAYDYLSIGMIQPLKWKHHH